MRIVPTFDHSSTKLFTVKFDGEELDALEKLRLDWASVEFLREFFARFQKDYFENYGKSNRFKTCQRVAGTCG